LNLSTGLTSASAFIVNATVTNLLATNLSAGSIALGDATVGNLYVTNNGTIANAYLNTATVGSLVVNNVNITPSAGDIGQEASFAAANNQSSPADVTDFIFDTSVRAFTAQVSVTILTTGDANNKFAYFTLQGIQKSPAGSPTPGWVLNSRYIGDNTGVVFSIDATSGQIKYTSSNISPFVSDTMKFYARTTTV